MSLELTKRFASHYYGSVKAAQVAHESDLYDCEPLYAHSIAVALVALRIARQRFISHKNADSLIEDVVPALDMLLGTLAGYCGQHANDGTNRYLSQASPISKNLAQAGLFDWAILFGKDLHQHYESLEDKSSSINQILALSEHVERVLWQFGIFVSDVEDGGMWIDACDDERLSQVEKILNS